MDRGNVTSLSLKLEWSTLRGNYRPLGTSYVPLKLDENLTTWPGAKREHENSEKFRMVPQFFILFQTFPSSLPLLFLFELENKHNFSYRLMKKIKFLIGIRLILIRSLLQMIINVSMFETNELL